MFRSWRKKQVLELLLREHPTGLTTKAMSKTLNVKVKTLARLLTRWKLQGVVSRKPYSTKGRPGFLYRITPAGRARLVYWRKKNKLKNDRKVHYYG